jgi:hypothetical protein
MPSSAWTRSCGLEMRNLVYQELRDSNMGQVDCGNLFSDMIQMCKGIRNAGVRVGCLYREGSDSRTSLVYCFPYASF